jgi:hypothetical protein
VCVRERERERERALLGARERVCVHKCHITLPQRVCVCTNDILPQVFPKQSCKQDRSSDRGASVGF